MTINELINKEIALGYHDGAIFGGFGAFVSAWAKEQRLSATQTLAEQYAAAPHQQRILLMEKLAASIPQQLKEEPLQQKSAAKQAPNTQLADEAALSTLNIPLVRLPNIGSKKAELFRKLAISTTGDLLEFYPRDYRDRRTITLIKDAPIGAQISIRGTVISTEVQRTRGKLTILRCYLRDASGLIPAIWFNQPFLQKKFYPGRELIVFGKVERRFNTIELAVEDYQLAEEADRAATGIVPVYSSCEGISQKTIRGAISDAWRLCGNGSSIANIVPPELLDKHQLLSRAEAIQKIHFPEDLPDIEQAHRSLAYEELLIIQLAIMRNNPKMRQKITRPQQRQHDQEILASFQGLLPYPLTQAQQRVIGEIYQDMNSNQPMMRLVQGDVGSGKTAVAAAAVAKCCLNGQQAAMMAPTELLATQHYHNLAPLLEQLQISVALLTSSTPAKEKRSIIEGIAAGSINFAVGTHALIQEGITFADLGLAITDEQHRFGVAQRSRLRGEHLADTLIMTATPIPRTLAMTIYADMSLSVIDELPPGRKPVRTYAVDYSYEQRIHAFIAKEVAKGRQVFIVCPLIEDSEAMDLASATAYYQRLQQEVFPNLHIGLLHGKMKPAEKALVMASFQQGTTDILVSTTVVEVGIDIPNASIILIRDAERFGLAQLHQLRGRIGRGQEEGHCILIHNAQSKIARERMDILCQSTDGFALAEADLRLRGPGEFFGKRQHGLPSLKIADVFNDQELLAAAHQDALIIEEGLIPSTAQLAKAVTDKMALLS